MVIKISGRWGECQWRPSPLYETLTTLTTVVLLQGLDVSEDGVRPISQVIGDILGVEMSALIGANIADEISQDKFAEATIGRLSTYSKQI